MNIVKGYKVFNPDWTCKNKQYTCPGKFEEDVELFICDQGMHFCKKAADCFNYYAFSPENKVAEVIAYGDVVEEDDNCVTDKLVIMREIPWSELLELVNTGKNNIGYDNVGDYNSGYHNRGDRNTGDCNIGNYNNGNHNSGNYNNGDCNSGNCNMGDWNNCNLSNGCFNTETPKIFLFNKPSDWTYWDWERSVARRILRQMPANNEWVAGIDMTAAEKYDNSSYETTRGYLKITVDNASRQKWWDNLSYYAKTIVKSIPNFDADIFKEITGINV